MVSAWRGFVAVLVLANVIKCAIGISNIDVIILVLVTSMDKGHSEIKMVLSMDCIYTHNCHPHIMVAIQHSGMELVFCAFLKVASLVLLNFFFTWHLHLNWRAF
jgi:hypothetical protein